ncbi:MAG: hypothetical protein A2126_03255 [Candidatus Woykebacteria bacterium GWB1_45_5]|uniref:Helix-hairpin-helix DNA-binding motif class 1 domain-containing protein n=2 Tax=Microgenomates group TaxID=1794810 RepID=A0A1G1W5V2_9BACT|nr:MAG: putative membrane protein [Candidatus Woesebacteria bacterium GW2011_GWA1_45_8]OGY22767.1 MAG: hypothetical protein A2126_03255 [Candidatus Woykebacteria bacterium GWB1_45_5]
MEWLKNKRTKKLLRLAKNYQVSLILALLGFTLLGAGLSIAKFSRQSSDPQFISAQGDQNGEEIVVDIAGAVNKPGVYSLPAGSRVSEAVDKASGLSGEADKAWVAQNLNFAAKLADGQKIYIPAIGQAGKVDTGTVAGQAAGKININTAPSGELDTLPGIGPVTAQKIIASRPYAATEELLSKKVVGASTFEKIKDKVTIY